MPTPDEARAELARRELQRREARRSLAAFCERYEPTYDPDLPHAKIVREHLEALERREIERLMIFMPPQHGKSFHATETFSPWVIGRAEERDERFNVAIAAHTAHLAHTFSRRAREKFESPFNPFDTKVSPKSAAVDVWGTLAGSQVVAAGIGGPFTGYGVHGFVIDDPIKDAAEAMSPVYRESNWEWYMRVARTRLRRNAWQLIGMTRWNEDDIAGRILNTKAAKRWTVLRLPARCIDPKTDPLHRKVGELLWPGGPEVPTPGDGETTTKIYESMYQQNPTPDEGDVFKREWMTRRYRELPGNLTHAAFYVDGAWKGEKLGAGATGISGSRSAIGVWATDGIDYYLVHAWAARVEYPELKAKVPDYYKRFCSVAPVFTPCVEDAASGIPIIQELRRTTHIPFVGVRVDVSKIVRAEAVTPLFEAQKVVLPEDAEWLDEWIEEHVSFPGGRTDDLVDTTSGALARLMDNVGLERKILFTRARNRPRNS